MRVFQKKRKSKKKLTELFDTNGDAKKGTFEQEETALQDYLTNTKAYMKDFIGKLVEHSKKFYGVLDFEKERGKNDISLLVPTLPSISSLAPTVSATTSTATSSTATSPPSTTTNVSANPGRKYDDKLNSSELDKIKDDIDYISGRLDNYGYYPSDDFNKIKELVFAIGEIIEEIYDSLSYDNAAVNINIKGLASYKKHLDELKYRVENNEFKIDIDDDEDLEEMVEELARFKTEYRYIVEDFYNALKGVIELKKAKKAS